jgi:ABC-2 type transport system permease protein
MGKIWRVARHEYGRHVFRRRFIVAVLSLPLVFAFTLLLVWFVARSEIDRRPAGVVDESGLLSEILPKQAESTGQVELRPYPTERLARQALAEGKIQAYFVIAADYLSSGRVQATALSELGGNARGTLEASLRSALLRSQPAAVAQRIKAGSTLEVVALDGNRRMRSNEVFNLFIPVFAFLVLMLTIFTTSGYLMQSVSEERENRTLEVMMTCLSPNQLMSGKTLGILGVGLTQLGIWLGAGLIFLGLARLSQMALPPIGISAGLIALMIASLLPALVIIAAGMAAIGAVVADFNEGNQISGPFSLPFLIPVILIGTILREPQGTLATWMTFIPFTAPGTLVLRASFSSVPAWQMAASLALLCLTAAGALWLAGRAFRMGMLHYGRPFYFSVPFLGRKRPKNGTER